MRIWGKKRFFHRIVLSLQIFSKSYMNETVSVIIDLHSPSGSKIHECELTEEKFFGYMKLLECLRKSETERTKNSLTWTFANKRPPRKKKTKQSVEVFFFSSSYRCFFHGCITWINLQNEIVQSFIIFMLKKKSKTLRWNSKVICPSSKKKTLHLMNAYNPS